MYSTVLLCRQSNMSDAAIANHGYICNVLSQDGVRQYILAALRQSLLLLPPNNEIFRFGDIVRRPVFASSLKYLSNLHPSSF
jgi:hypothetical protein